MKRSVEWYRFRATFSRRRGDYLVLVALIALIGGVAMGSVVAARLTQSSYPAFLAKTNASDLTLSTYGIGNGPQTDAATIYSPATEAAIARLPFVKRVESWTSIFAVPLDANGAPNLTVGDDINIAASETGLYFDVDRATPIAGRLPDPSRVDEFMTTSLGAHILGIHLGQIVPIGLYTAAQSLLPGFGTPKVPPTQLFHLKLVGIVEFNNQVVVDDTDRIPTNLVYTPAWTHSVPNSDTFGTWYGVQLDPGAPGLAAVEKSLLSVLPPDATGNFSETASSEAEVERSVRPESIALAVFGLIAALAALGTALPVMSRSLRSGEEDRSILRALGADPGQTLADGLLGLVLATVIGTVLAGALAVAASELAPLGPIRRVFHPRGLSVDWTVIGAGCGFFAATLLLSAVVLAVRTSPQRLSRADRDSRARPSRLAHTAAAAGLPLPGVVGLRFALEPGRGRTATPARSVLAGAALAVMTVTATLTFGASLNVLVTHPSLYGWNWTYALYSLNDVPPQALAALSHDPDVQSWSGYSDPGLLLDGRNVPALVTQGIPAVNPPILSGHPIRGAAQVVVGPSTLGVLHKRVGDTIDISYGSPNTAPLYLPPTPALIVGTATFPDVAGSSTFAQHPTMGIGVQVTTEGLPPSFIHATQASDPTLQGPGLAFVRLRPGVSPAAGQKDMQRVIGIAAAAFAKDPNAAGDSVVVLPVQRPAEIVNYQSTGGTSALLAAALGVGASVALVLALVATVRRRRADLALLKTLGCTRRQLALTLFWQATATAVIGVAVGLPVGIAAGRQLWILYARSINVVPQPSVPWTVVLVAIGTLLLAAAVAAVPGRVAARTPVAVVLRQE